MAIEEVRVEEEVDNLFPTGELDQSSSDDLSQEQEDLDVTASSEKKKEEPAPDEKKPEDTPANRAFAAMRVENANLKRAQEIGRQEQERVSATLTETQQRLAFIEDQQKKAARKKELTDTQEKNRIYLDGLRESGSDNYESERDRLLREDLVEAVTPPAEESKPEIKSKETPPDPQKIATFQNRIEKTNEKINTDFPEMLNQDSPLFKKSVETLFGNNSPDEVDYMLKNHPEMFYTHIKFANTLLENEKLKTGSQQKESEGVRQGRISGQGAGHSQGSSGDSADKLSPAQRTWCKEMGFNPKEYAKFAHLGGKNE